MPGIDTDGGGAAGLDGLPDRLATLLLDATSALEREAAEAKSSAEAIARKVGVIARSGAALALFGVRLARRGARPAPGDPVPTEQADMDDADDARPEGATSYDLAFLERGVRNLSRNLGLGTGDGGAADGAGPSHARGGDRELGLPGASPSVAA